MLLTTDCGNIALADVSIVLLDIALMGDMLWDIENRVYIYEIWQHNVLCTKKVFESKMIG